MFRLMTDHIYEDQSTTKNRLNKAIEFPAACLQLPVSVHITSLHFEDRCGNEDCSTLETAAEGKIVPSMNGSLRSTGDTANYSSQGVLRPTTHVQNARCAAC